MGSWNENGIKNGNGNGKGNRKHIMESHSKKMTVKSHHHHLVGKAKHIACRAIHPMTFNLLTASWDLSRKIWTWDSDVSFT